MTNRLLLIEPSATMRYVLDKHAQSLGFSVDAVESYSVAADSLNKQYQQFGTEYSGLLFGWPITAQDDAAKLAELLEQSAYKDLPVVVMSTDMRAETRAWVAERDNTAVLPWKEYQGLEPLLQKLIEVDADDSSSFPVKADNSDIHLLVVDDSATIRYSLRDLFQMQGYRVSLAATQKEAMQLATKAPMDIAVLDFYLTETTGDLLCRDLLSNPSVGDIVCTVLTGTYSDHIIKRSLRAGAVECMFKNESSELLLSRIGAISRFVRNNRHLRNERILLDEAMETLAGAVLFIEPDHRISYINNAGLRELRLSNRNLIVGRQSETLLELDGPKPTSKEQYHASWRLPNGKSIDVDYEHMRIEPAGRSLIRFARASISIANNEAPAKEANVAKQAEQASAPSQLQLYPSSAPFVKQMQWYLSNEPTVKDCTSLMIMDVFVVDKADKRSPVSDIPTLTARVNKMLHSIYKRPSHVALLKGNRFGILLRHRQEAQVYLLVRKIMQLCIELEHYHAELKIQCTGSLLSLVGKKGHSREALLQHAFKGVELVNAREPNQILLMDLRRMLNAYPAKENSPPQ